jgi:hypothetical protein
MLVHHIDHAVAKALQGKERRDEDEDAEELFPVRRDEDAAFGRSGVVVHVWVDRVGN